MFEDGDIVTVDATAGTVEIEGVEMKESVSSAVVMDGWVLMLKRPESSHSFPGVWSLVAGRVEPGELPEDAARREIREETAIEVGSPAASLGPVYVREGRILWKVHPFAFSVSGVEPVLNEENEGFQWVLPEDIPGVETVKDTVPVVEGLLKQF